MEKALCIHGHFYQPPREDPWLNNILPEGSAAPAFDWNQRITHESYAPMARARRLDGAGRIVEMMNCYEWMSFNAGPTMLAWLAGADPDTYRRMQEADRLSLARLGHGNAIAQVYHHQILPLASTLDKELETAWAVDDFTARFGRAPEGMWLAEAAVDTQSLEALARHGIVFTILAPGQAKAVAPLEGGDWSPVNPGNLDIRAPYRLHLPSGRSIDIFFYDGPLSQAVAFERLLADGETFWRRLSQAAGPGLLTLATDGETYGHHFTFGEMALAFVLDQARSSRDGLGISNFAAHLAAHPPTRQVQLHEPSAWSCAHGVERWRSNCGCTDGGHPGWRQDWRAPLRQALQRCKDMLDEHFFTRGADCFADPRKALVAYGKVLAESMSLAEYGAAHFRKNLPEDGQAVAWKLLAMQQWGLASLASCAWFFDEVSRIEPVNGLTFALRAMELCLRTGGPDIEAEILPILQTAPSNLPEYGNAATIWAKLVKPRQETPGSLIAQALITLWGQDRLPQPGQSEEVVWPGVRVAVAAAAQPTGAGTEVPGAPTAQTTPLGGTATIQWAKESGAERYAFSWQPPHGNDPLAAAVRVAGPDSAAGTAATGGPEGATETFQPRALPVNKRQALADAWITVAGSDQWDKAVQRMACGAHLVCEIQEAQTTLTLAPQWAGMWAALAWTWVWGMDLENKQRELLHVFLRQTDSNAIERQDLAQRLSARTLAMLASDEPEWGRLCEMVQRVRGIGLTEDWWAVQNHLWDTGLHQGAGTQFAALLGFAQ